MENNKQQTQILGKVIHQLSRLENQPRFVSGVGEVSPSEFHIIEAIGGKEAVTGKKISQSLGITKGAVSQILPKLEKKQLITRKSAAADLRIQYLSLTTLGRQVYLEHVQIEQEFQEILKQELSIEQQAAFNQGLELLSNYLASQIN